MTSVGLDLTKKSLNSAKVSRLTGRGQARLNKLTSIDLAKLREDKSYLIVLVTGMNIREILEDVFSGLKLENK